VEDKKSITRFILTLSRVFSYFLKGFDWDLTKFQVDMPIKESNDEVVEAANERHALYEISEPAL
jgi:hypothetical protein